MSRLKNYIKTNNTIYNFVQLLVFLKNSKLFRVSGLRKKYPRVIQLPITYRCNSKCVMCNIWKMDWSNEMDLQSFKTALKSKLFKKVIAVGINGGEPSFVKQLPEYTEAILQLPKLKSLNIISHGFNQKLLLPKLKEMYKRCKLAGVKFHVSISLDGVGDVHNKVRGLDIFKITSSTIDEINNNSKKYCDSFDTGCTVIQQNVDDLKELDAYVKAKGIPIKYRLGISNKRIESYKILDEFSVFNKQASQSAKEFFYTKIGKESGIYNKFKYFSIYYFLKNNYSKRLLGCMWKDNGVTLDSRGNLYYCAVESKKIGNILTENGEKVFFSKNNLSYRKSIVEEKCNSCIHDYAGKPELKNLLPFIKEIILKNYFTSIYKFLSHLT
jgi:sulfatase maturation enzyme AslB (radical SAM superfamily)